LQRSNSHQSKPPVASHKRPLMPTLSKVAFWAHETIKNITTNIIATTKLNSVSVAPNLK